MKDVLGASVPDRALVSDQAPAGLAAPRLDPSRETQTHDLSMRIWGRNYNIMGIENEGARLRLAIWATPMPRQGDYLILKNGGGTCRYQIASVETCGNPRDMAFVDADFAPREVQP